MNASETTVLVLISVAIGYVMGLLAGYLPHNKDDQTKNLYSQAFE